MLRRLNDDEEAIDLLAEVQDALEDPCPVCDGVVRLVKAKAICINCNSIVANCCGD